MFLEPLHVNPFALRSATGALVNVADRHWEALRWLDEQVWLGVFSTLREGQQGSLPHRPGAAGLSSEAATGATLSAAVAENQLRARLLL